MTFTINLIKAQSGIETGMGSGSGKTITVVIVSI